MSKTAALDANFQGWHTSSYSQPTGNADCVAVGYAAAAIGVGDTKNPNAGVLEFPKQAWRDFLAGVGNH